MKSVDPQMAARVWQRVQGTAGSAPQQAPETQSNEPEQLLRLYNLQLLDAGYYQQLVRHLRGQQRAVLQGLFRQKRAAASCIRGMYTMLTGNDPPLPPMQPRLTGRASARLRRCYADEKKSREAFHALESHPEYGQVFARLSEQARENCQSLLILIGSIGK